MKKIAQQQQSSFLAFLRMELRANDIVAPNHRGQLSAVLNRRHHRIIGPAAERKAMDKIGVRAGRYAGKNRMPAGNDRKFVPSHMGYLEALVDRFKGRNLAPDPAKPFMLAMFHAALCQKLHTDADPEKGSRVPQHCFGQGIAHAGQAIQSREAIAKRANAGQNNSVGAPDPRRP